MLFENINIGKNNYGIQMRNRIVRSATGENAAVRDTGEPTDAMANFYNKLAQCGYGLIITGHTAVALTGRCHNLMTAFYSDNFIPSFRKITEVCHKHNTPVVCQINHGGRQVNPEHRDIRAVCPSKVAVNPDIVPEELNETEIYEIIDAFGKAAKRVKEAGFDGVQIHSAHGYLISQFNSPLTNKRSDKWGGTTEKRRLFLKEIFLAIKKYTGDSYPVLVKQNVSDFHPDGLSEQDALEICKMLDNLGIDAIELSGGIAETIPVAFRSEKIRKERESVFFEKQALTIKKSVRCPVILTGGIRSRSTAERLIRTEVCDCIGLCRPTIREPDIPIKWKNNEKDLCDCISCGQCKSSEERANFCALI